MVAYLKVEPQVRMYSDYLRAAREAKKKTQLNWLRAQGPPPVDGPTKTRATTFFPLRNLKGNQPFNKKTHWYALLNWRKKDADKGKDQGSDDPDGIEGVTKEFMVQLARAVKDAQAGEMCCYHCNSPEHFICNCPLMKTARDKKQLNGKEGMVTVKGAWTPLKVTSAVKSPQQEAQEA